MWNNFKEIDFKNPIHNRFVVDTRDFHTSSCWLSNAPLSLTTISKYPDFFFTESELTTLLERLYTESGGNVGWRFLELTYLDARVKGWYLKYLRIYRIEQDKFVVCNDSDRAVTKTIFNSPVDQRHLNAH